VVTVDEMGGGVGLSCKGLGDGVLGGSVGLGGVI